MRSRTKFLIGCLALTGLGIVLSIVGFAMGGAVYGIQIDASGLHVAADSLKQDGAGKAIEQEETVGEFDNISIDMEYVDVNLVPSDLGDYRVSYCIEESDGLKCKVEDRTLVIGQEKNVSWFGNAAFFSIGRTLSESKDKTPLVTVYVPAKAKLSQVEVKTESGNISCRDLQAESLVAVAEYGDIEINNVGAQTAQARLESGNLRMKQVQGGSFKVHNEYGDLVLEDVAFTEDMSADLESGDMEYQNLTVRDLQVKNSYGAITGYQMKVRNLYAELESGDCNLSAISLDSCEVEAAYGNVEMGLVKPLEDYTYDLNVEYGDITLDGRQEGNSYHSLGKGKQHQLNISCESGDITLQKVSDS